jgi:hypothetical protein
MKINFTAFLLILLAFLGVFTNGTAQSFAGKEYYSTLRSDDLDRITRQLSALDDSNTGDRAKKGALLMRKSGLLKTPAEKLKVFKNGRELLEAAIKKEDNLEFHFLRLIIQEQAPSPLNYNKDIESDAAMLKSGLPLLDGELQQEVLDYSKVSKHLKLSE